MSDTMNSRIFARKWLEKEGLFDKDSDYNGWLGDTVMEVVELIARQGHSGGSASRLYDILQRIYQDYDNNDSSIWQEYWESDDGKALKASLEAPSETITVSMNFFEHLLTCLANQKFIHDVNADGLEDGIESVRNTQAENQRIIDEAYRKGWELLRQASIPELEHQD